MSHRLARLLVLGAGLLAATPSLAQTSASITGRVLDADTNRPLDGLTVAVPDLSRSTMTDAEGRFTLRDLPAGDFIVTIAGLGYTPFSETRTIADGVHLEIELTPQPIQIEEVVVDIETIDEVFRARRNSSAYRNRVYFEDDLPMTAFATVRQLLSFQAGLVMCPPVGMAPNPAAGIFSTSLQMSMAGIQGCVFSRGRSVPVAVYVDEEFSLGGVEALEAYNPAEIYAVELRRNGTEIRLFTKRFIERAQRGTRMLSRTPSFPPGGPGG